MTEQSQTDILDSLIKTNKKRAFISRPHNFFLLAAIILPVIPLFFWGQGLIIGIDKIQLFITSGYFIYALSILFLLWWLIYRFTNKRLLADYLSWVHVGISIAIVFWFLITGFWFLKMLEPDRIQSRIVRQLMINKERRINLISWPAILFLLGQLMYIINLAGWFLQRHFRK